MTNPITKEERLARLEELKAALAREHIKYEQIRYYFSSPSYSIKNIETTNEVCKQLAESAIIMNKFREDYRTLMNELKEYVNMDHQGKPENGKN